MALANIILDALTTKRGTVDLKKPKQCLFFDGGRSVLDAVTIMDIDVVEDSKILTSPTESGSIIADHRVIMPIEIKVRCCAPINDWDGAYAELKTWFDNKDSRFLTIATKSDDYDNMQLVTLPHKESAESIDRLFFDLVFREVKFVKPSYENMALPVVENPDNAKTEPAGEKKPKSWAKSIGGLLGF